MRYVIHMRLNILCFLQQMPPTEKVIVPIASKNHTEMLITECKIVQFDGET